jgi:glycerophosphoryl diester phosphodiesterase
VATEYCTVCPGRPNCERLITDTIEILCTDETSAYYQCLIDNTCETTACDSEWEARTICMGTAPVDEVRNRITSLTPSANLGQRGTGPTRPGHPFPENSILSFLAAIEEGADGVELDLQLTADGDLIVMNDPTVDRTTTGTGCVSALTFDEIRATRLLDGDGDSTDERPPTLSEVYSAIGGNLIVDIELKVFESTVECPEGTVIGGQGRTIFSSSDATAVDLAKMAQPDYYSALLSDDVEAALSSNQDAIHPDMTVSTETVQAALEAGLQVNVIDANTAEQMMQQIEKGSTGIITDEPGTLADLLAMEP